MECAAVQVIGEDAGEAKAVFDKFNGQECSGQNRGETDGEGAIGTVFFSQN